MYIICFTLIPQIMKDKILLFMLAFVLGGVMLISCQDEYDPIGNNKPAPVLKLDSKFAAVPGGGGIYPINITTNVPEVEAKSTVSWLSGTYGEEVVTLSATANTEDIVRETLVSIATVTGNNEAQSTVRVIQASQGMDKIFANMLRAELTSDWKVIKPNGTWTIEENALRANSPGDVQSIMVFGDQNAKTVRSVTREFRYSVDVKNSNNWAGIVFHATDAKNFFYIGLNINPTSLFVIVSRMYNGSDAAHAMDPGIVLSAERDPYLRCEIVSNTDKPNEFTLNVYELKTSGDVTLNTDVSEVQKLAYTRTFNDALMAEGGYAGVWGKVGGGFFKRFVLTTN
jgi:hypothetical protein